MNELIIDALKCLVKCPKIVKNTHHHFPVVISSCCLFCPSKTQRKLICTDTTFACSRIYIVWNQQMFGMFACLNLFTNYQNCC